MSANLFLRNTAIVAIGAATLTLTACASSNSGSTRYGNVYDYESGQNCSTACTAPAVVQAPVVTEYSGYVETTPTVVYEEPSYTAPVTYTAPATSYASTSVECPAGTTSQADGTCLQSGYDTTSYSTTTSYTTAAPVVQTVSTVSTAVECPAGTTAQSDGTCLQGSSTSVYTGGTATIYADPPATTTTTTTYGGYENGGYTAKTYLPIRK